jgi:hypothetical protein
MIPNSYDSGQHPAVHKDPDGSHAKRLQATKVFLGLVVFFNTVLEIL